MKHTFRAVRHKTAKLWHWVAHKLKEISPLRLAEDTLLLVVVLQFALLGMNVVNRDQPILGMRLEGQLVGRLGGDSQQELASVVQSYENKVVPVQVADVKSSVTMRQLGVNINEEKVRENLLSIGREGNIFSRWFDQNRAAVGLLNVQLPNEHFNNDMAAAYVATLNPKIDISPQNAYFAYQNQQVAIVSAKDGRTIDTDKAIQLLRNTDPVGGIQTTLPTKVVPAQVTAGMLQTILPEVQKIAQKPLTITAGSSQTTLSPEQLVSVVVPKVITDPNDPKKTTVQVTFDEAKLNAIVDEVIGRAVVAPKPTIMSGGKVIQQGKEGIRTEDSHALAHVLKALVQRQTGVAVPDVASIPLVTVTPPVVVQQPKTTGSNPRTKTGTGNIRLTFDDGPGGYTNQILDILKRYNVHATFYVIGRNVESYPDTMRRIKNEGHRIGNHSYSHPNLTGLSRAGVTQQLTQTQNAIMAACGVKPTAFRPPYGAHNATVRSVAAELGMSVDMWSIDTRDWAKPGSSVITRRVLDNTHSGAVVLLHVLNQQTVNALPSIIEGVRAQGYTLE